MAISGALLSRGLPCPAGPPEEMDGDSGPEGQKEHSRFYQRELTDAQRGQRQGCECLLGWEVAGKAQAPPWSTLGPGSIRRGDGFWGSLLPLRRPGPPPLPPPALLQPLNLPARGRGCWGCARLRSEW